MFNSNDVEANLYGGFVKFLVDDQILAQCCCLKQPVVLISLCLVPFEPFFVGSPWNEGVSPGGSCWLLLSNLTPQVRMETLSDFMKTIRPL